MLRFAERVIANKKLYAVKKLMKIWDVNNTESIVISNSIKQN